MRRRGSVRIRALRRELGYHHHARDLPPVRAWGCFQQGDGGGCRRALRSQVESRVDRARSVV